MADFGLFEFATSLWRRWRWGLPEDTQQGLELGTFRAVSCPQFPKVPQTGYAAVNATTACPPEKEKLQGSTSVPLKDPPPGIGSSGSFEFAPASKTSEDIDGTSSDQPIDASVQFFKTSSSSTDINEEGSLFVESMDLDLMIRYANRFLEDGEMFEEGNMERVVKRIQEGVVPCLLLNSVVDSEMVDVRALNIPNEKNSLTREERFQNHILCCKSLAAADHNQRLSRMNPDQLSRGNAEACIILLRSIVDLGTVQMIDVHTFPELRTLQEDSEDIFQFLQLLPEDLLLRWVNFTISQNITDSSNVIQNLGDDFKDIEAFLKLQNAIEPSLATSEKKLSTREYASLVLDNCEVLKVDIAHSVEDLIAGDSHLNAIFLAQHFMSHHGLSLPSESIEDREDVDEFDNEGSREERTFRMWMNSLGCEMNCRSLFSADFRTGWMLLQVLESLHPNSIDWTIANKPPFKTVVHRIKSVENCDQVIRVAKDSLHLSLVGIGGDDIADGKKKPILALVWQMLRFHTLMILNSVLESSASPRSVVPSQGNGDTRGRLNEADVLAWANHMLDISGSSHRITSFKDPDLSTSHALLALLKAIEPSAVQEKHISPGISSIEKEMNAKYVLSLSRKLGATIFIVWEDIVDVKPKMMLMLIASFTLLDKQLRKLHRAATKSQGTGRNIRVAL